MIQKSVSLKYEPASEQVGSDTEQAKSAFAIVPNDLLRRLPGIPTPFFGNSFEFIHTSIDLQ